MRTKDNSANHDKESEDISVREAGRRGGCTTLERKGVEFFKEIGRKGGRKTSKLYSEVLKDFGRRGGRPRRPNLNGSMGEEDYK